MEIERDGDTVATVKKALISPLRERFSIDVHDGADLEAKGNIVDHEYEINTTATRSPKCRSGGSGFATPTGSRWIQARTRRWSSPSPCVSIACPTTEGALDPFRSRAVTGRVRSLFGHIRQDATAGAALGVESVPDGLATGLLAGVNPLAGVYGYMVGTVAGALSTSSTFMAVQGTGAMAILVADVTVVHDAADPTARWSRCRS